MIKFNEMLYNASPAWVQDILVSAYGYKLYRKRYSGPVFDQVKRDIERLNAMSAMEQNTFQAERLHEMIKHCRRYVPYYSKLLADLSLTEHDFTDPYHIKKLPILDKQPIRETPELFRARGATPYMVQNTSGSTGTPLSLWVDEYTYKLAMALLIDHEERHGVKFGAKRATFAGRMIQPIDQQKPPFSRFNKAENQRLFSAYHISHSTFPFYDQELARFEPEEIIGYPSAIFDIATQYQSNSKTPAYQPKAIITNSETLLDWQRSTIESVFDCKVYDYYGTAEYVTFAGQCDHGNYHFHPLIGLTEINPQNEMEGFEPDQGHIVATSLTNFVMPLLRYRIGDTAKFTSGQCACGNQSVSTRHIFGRIDDVIQTVDGRKIGRIDHIFKGVKNIKEAQVVQTSLFECIIKVVPGNCQYENELKTIEENFSTRIGDTIKIKFEVVDEIQRGANGKFRSVIGLKND